MNKPYFPKVRSVTAKSNYTLIVTFDNQINKCYDCQQLLKNPLYQLLREIAFFKSVKVDAGGYGISWNDDLDLSEYELWTHGTEIKSEKAEPETIHNYDVS